MVESRSSSPCSWMGWFERPQENQYKMEVLGWMRWPVAHPPPLPLPKKSYRRQRICHFDITNVHGRLSSCEPFTRLSLTPFVLFFFWWNYLWLHNQRLFYLWLEMQSKYNSNAVLWMVIGGGNYLNPLKIFTLIKTLARILYTVYFRNITLSTNILTNFIL